MSRFLSYCLLLLLFSPLVAVAQDGPPANNPQIEYALTFSDGSSEPSVVYFGLDVRGSDGYDDVAALGEKPSGPPWPIGLHARFFRSSDGEYDDRDIRGGAPEDKNLTKTHILEMKKADGDVTSEVTVSWSLDSWVSVVLVNADAETIVTMTNSGSYTFANDSFGDLQDTKFTMTVTYTNIPPGLLPVELTSFTSLVQDNRAVLHWETASETNNAGFEVQQRVNGEYQAIGYVNGRGTTTEKQRYTFRTRELASGSHDFRLKQIDFDGGFEYVAETEITLMPVATTLWPNFPNPFNPSTIISYDLPIGANVKLAVYDVSGKKVAVLVNGFRDAGRHEVEFIPDALPSGVYVYQLETPTRVIHKKMMLLK